MGANQGRTTGDRQSMWDGCGSGTSARGGVRAKGALLDECCRGDG